MTREILETYKIKCDDVSITVNIIGGEGKSITYEISLSDISKATLALLDEVRNILIAEVQVSAKEIIDPKVVDTLKEKFRKKAADILVEKLTAIDNTTKDFLVNHLIREMLGLGEIEFLLNDINIEEIVINSANEPIRIYHKNYGWVLTNITVASETQIQNYSNIIARRVGRQINTLNPLLDAHLLTGDRFNAVLYPISSKGNTITIRKFSRDPWTVTDFIKNKTVNAEVMSIVWLSMQYEMNMLVSGGTASGKTSFLNICMPFIPPNHRILTIEDTRELQLPSYLYWCPLVTRLPNPEGKGEVCMYPGSLFVSGNGELLEISNYVERKLAKGDKIIDKNMIATKGDGDTIIAGDPLTLKYQKEEIKAFSKNLNRKYICDIICEDGTKFSITENTKIPALTSEGKISLLNPFELQELSGKIRIPLFTKIRIDSDIQKINLFEIFDKNDLYACNIKEEYIELENNLRKNYTLNDLAVKCCIKRQNFNYYRKTGIVNMHILKTMIELSDFSVDQFEGKIKHLKGKGATANLVKIPRIVNEDLAYFAGFVLAEKYITKNRILLTQKEEISYILDNLTNKLFDLKVKKSKKNYNKYGIFSSVISYLMKELFNASKAKEIRVPKIIMRSPEEVISAFLSGYIDGDGTIDKGRISMSSVNEEIINEFKYLFNRLGIRSSTYEYLAMNRLNKIYTLNITTRKDLQLASKILPFRKKSNIEKAKINIQKEFKEGTSRNRVPISFVINHIEVLKKYLTEKERYNF
ncbi:Flp pilus assembly complex ATPase component TadA, partial [Candidatus Woesearchaeota archaeon]|nr:Flp pilus assembly complex ATPase component TadA [Candidatus Woesearchaeota archaeon]